MAQKTYKVHAHINAKLLKSNIYTCKTLEIKQICETLRNYIYTKKKFTIIHTICYKNIKL